MTPFPPHSCLVLPSRSTSLWLVSSVSHHLFVPLFHRLSLSLSLSRARARARALSLARSLACLLAMLSCALPLASLALFSSLALHHCSLVWLNVSDVTMDAGGKAQLRTLSCLDLGAEVAIVEHAHTHPPTHTHTHTARDHVLFIVLVRIKPNTAHYTCQEGSTYTNIRTHAHYIYKARALARAHTRNLILYKVYIPMIICCNWASRH